MENSALNKSSKYEREINSLDELLKTGGFPIIAKIVYTNELAGTGLIENREVLIQSRLKTKYAQVKILDFDDKEKIQEVKGIDFVMEHDNFVDDSFLIPIKYSGSVKFVHRPGSWKRFPSILQVLQELPRFVRVEEDTVAIPSNGIGKNIIVPSKTVLEVVRKFTVDGTIFLECSDGHTSYAFSEKDRVNFTEVEDEKAYHLFELVRLKLLPRVFQFQDVFPADIIQMSEELNSGLLTMVGGPMELTRFVDVDIIIGWIRDNKDKTYKAFVVESRLGNCIKLQKRAFLGEREKQIYVERKYRHCINTDFVEKSLHVLPIDHSEITWLRSPDFYERNYSGSAMFDVVPIDFQDSSDDASADEGGEYTRICDNPPPVPERRTKLPLPNGSEVPTLLHPKVKEKMNLFERVHIELLNWFTPRHMQTKGYRKERKDKVSNTRAQNHGKKALVTRNRSRYSSEGDACKSKQGKHFKQQRYHVTPALGKIKFHSSESIIEETSQYLHPDGSSERLVVSQENLQSVAPSPPNRAVSNHSLQTSSTSSSVDSDLDGSDSDSSRDYDYPEFNAYDFTPPITHPNFEATDSATLVSDVNSTKPKLPKRNNINTSVQSVLTDLSAHDEHIAMSTLTRSEETESSDLFQSFEISRSENQSEVNLVEDNFFRLSVFETAQCFRECGLGEFADGCFENRLDGSFFRNLDLNTFKGDPFYLSNFKILKIRKIISEGWRPNAD